MVAQSVHQLRNEGEAVPVLEEVPRRLPVESEACMPTVNRPPCLATGS